MRQIHDIKMRTICSSNGSECIYRCHKFQNFLGEAPPSPQWEGAPSLVLSPLKLAPSVLVKHSSPMSKSFRRPCNNLAYFCIVDFVTFFRHHCKGKDQWLVTVTLNLGNGNQKFVGNTPSYSGLPFSEIWLNLISSFWIVRDKLITYDYDLDLGHRNLNFVLSTPSYNALPLCEICVYMICKWQTFDLRLWLWP